MQTTVIERLRRKLAWAFALFHLLAGTTNGEDVPLTRDADA